MKKKITQIEYQKKKNGLKCLPYYANRNKKNTKNTRQRIVLFQQYRLDII